MMNLLDNFKLKNEDQKIALSDNNGLHFYELKNIVRCQSDNSYTEFHVLGENQKDGSTQKIIVSRAISDFEDFLVGKGFFYRIHNQHIVNINHIKKFAKDNGSYLVLDVNPRETIPVARSRKDDFVNFLRSKGIVI
jgi:two-component system LytT family response regulator